jgi:hypothetical protein
MEDNNFIEPTVAIYEQQEIRVGNSISEIESNCNTSPLLLSGLNNVKKKGPEVPSRYQTINRNCTCKKSMLSGIKIKLTISTSKIFLK